MSEQHLDAELTALEQALGHLEPQACLSRDALFYQAGQAAARGRWLWPCSTAVSTLAAAILAWLVWHQPSPERERTVQLVVVEKPVPQPPAPAPPAPAPSAPERDVPETRDLAGRGMADYLRRRQEILRWGVEMLPAAPPQTSPGEPLTPASAPRLSGEPIDWKKLFTISSILFGAET